MTFFNKTCLSLPLAALLLAGCSSGGGGGTAKGAGDPGLGGAPDLGQGTDKPAVSVGEIAGVWDISADVEENGTLTFDEGYLVIGKLGFYAVYDYLGDEYSTEYQNCYNVDTIGTIDPNGDGTFDLDLISSGFPYELENVPYSVANGRLVTAADPFNPGEEMVFVPPADVSEETLKSMTCEE